MISECGAVGGIRTGRRKQNTWRKHVQVPLLHHKFHKLAANFPRYSMAPTTLKQLKVLIIEVSAKSDHNILQNVAGD
jgi:hypothetical protein